MKIIFLAHATARSRELCSVRISFGDHSIKYKCEIRVATPTKVTGVLLFALMMEERAVVRRTEKKTEKEWKKQQNLNTKH